MTAGDVVTRFIADITGFASGISRMTSMASSFSSDMAGHVRTVGSHFANMGKNILGSVESVGRWLFFSKQVATTAFDMVRGFFSQNAAMEQTRTAFIGLLGGAKQADAMLRQLQAFAAATPFEFPELAKDTQMLVGMGFAANTVIPVMTAVGDAAAGVGAGADGVNRITLALGQMQARGKVTGQDMMQLTEAGIPAWKILADSMHLSVAQVQKLSETGKLGADSVTLLWQGMERVYGGQMKAQATTFNGLMSTLHDNAMMALMAFAGPAFEMAKNALFSLTTLAGSPAFLDFARTMGVQVGGALASMVVWVQQAVAWLGSFSGQVVAIGTTMAGLVAWLQRGSAAALLVRDAFAGLGVAAGSIALAALIAGFYGLAVAAGTAAVSVIAATWPVLAVAAAIAALVAGFLYFYRTSEPFRALIAAIGAGFQQLWAVLSANVMPILSAIGGFLAAQFVPVWQQLVGVWNSSLLPSLRQLWAALAPLMPVLQDLGKVLGLVLVVALGLVVGAISGLVRGLAGFLTGLSTVIAGVVQIITGAVQVISGIVTFLDDLLTGRFSKLSGDLGRIWDGIVNIFGGAWRVIIGIFQTAWLTVYGIVTGFVQGVIGFFTYLRDRLVGHSIIPEMLAAILSIWNATIGQLLALVASLVSNLLSRFTALGSWLFAKWGEIRTSATSAWTALKDSVVSLVTTLWTNVTNRATAIKNSLISSFTSARDSVIGVVRGMVNGMINALNGGINALRSFLNGIADAINTVESTLGVSGGRVGHVAIGNIPRLARGTKGFAGGMAMVGEQGPELVYLPGGTQVATAGQTKNLLGLLPGFAGGIGDIFSNITGVFSHLTDIGGYIVNSLVGAFHMPGVLSGIPGALAGKLGSAITNFITGLMPKATTVAGAGGTFGTPVGVPGNVTSWILAAMALTGVPGSWLGALTTIAMHESGGNPNSINLWDINAKNGIPSQGLFQTIPPTFAAHALPGHMNILNPIDNAAAAIGYIIGRYGSVFNVPGIVSMAHGGPYVGYAGGGVITEPIVGVGASGTRYRFGENGPETVIPGRGGGGNREIVDALGRIEHVLAGGRRVTRDEIMNALGSSIYKEVVLQLGAHP